MKKVIIIVIIAALIAFAVLSNVCFHSWKDATCTEKKTCHKCGATEGEPLGHDYTSSIVSEPSCTSDGIAHYTCSRCGDSYDETVPALGHIEEVKILKEPQCEDGGLEEIYCSRCLSLLSTLTLSPLGHSPGEIVVEKDSTCTEEGTGSVYCTRCGEKLEEEVIEKKPHEYGKEVIMRKPTCTKGGLALRKCSNCGFLLFVNIEKIPHQEERKLEKEPTCTENGIYSVYCLVCGSDLGKEMIEPKGHTPESRIIRDATCSKEGLVSVYCTVCNELISTTVVEKTAHSYVFTRKEPTCSEGGYVRGICSVCGAGTLSPLDKTAHVEGRIEIEKGEGCTETIIYFCAVCGEEIKRETNESHIFDEIAVYSDDMYSVTCPRCSKSFADKSLSVLESMAPDIKAVRYLLPDNSVEMKVCKDEKVTYKDSTAGYYYYLTPESLEVHFYFESNKNKLKTKNISVDIPGIKVDVRIEDDEKVVTLGKLEDVIPLLYTSSLGTFSVKDETGRISGFMTDTELTALIYVYGVAKGPAGGYVSYSKKMRSDGWRFIEVAPQDIKSIWDDSLFETLNTSDKIGDGRENTALLKGTEIADAAAAYSNNGYSDWFVPSKEELKFIYNSLYLNGLGNLSPTRYWSSSSMSSVYAYWLNFENGKEASSRTIDNKRTKEASVRLIRYF